MIVAVYGVSSPREAKRFELAGANVLGIFLGKKADGRVVDHEMALAIKRGLSGAHLCVEAWGDGEIAPEVALRTGARWVQTSWGPPVAVAWRQQLAEYGIGWVLSRVPANEDDDPEWVRGRITEYGNPAPVWTHVELCPDLEDGWPMLREANTDELDLSDVDRMAEQLPIVVSAPLTVERLAELRALLPNVHGVALTLAGCNGGIPGAALTNVDDTLAIVSALREHR